MSKPQQRWGDLEADDARTRKDPHGIVPEAFWQRYDSIEQARREVESTFGDPNREDLRCPECETPNIVFKPGASADAPEHKRDGDIKCQNSRCGAHFNTPLPSKADAAAGEQVDFEVLDS